MSSANHNNTQQTEHLVQFAFLISNFIFLGLLWFWGINAFSDFYHAGIHHFFKKMFFPLQNELITKTIMLVILTGYIITRSLKKKENIHTVKQIVFPITFGIVLYYTAIFILLHFKAPLTLRSWIYIINSAGGYTLLLYGLANAQKLIHFKTKFSQFDKENKTFPMEKRKIVTPYSINIQCEKSWINIVNPFAGVNVLALPGSGKTFVFVMESIIQLLQKGFTACIYDFKEGELSSFAWNVFNYYHDEIKEKVPNIEFNIFNPIDPIKSVRINPISPDVMKTPEHCIDAATTFYYNLIPGAADKRGDIFFPESGRAYMCSLFLFLRFSTLQTKKNRDGKATEGNCCTLAHVIALGSYMNEHTGKGQDEFYNILGKKKVTAGMFRAAFGDAIESKAGKQLAGQVASGKLPLAFLDSENLFWCLTGDDVTLDVNNPDKPQILCLKNAGESLAEMYSPILGLIVGQVMKIINTNDRLPCLLSVDEAYTIFLRDIDKLIATGRSRKIATFLVMQDYQMLEVKYKKEQAEVIKNVAANQIAGRVSGSTAEFFEKKFGKTLHDRVSTTITRQDIQQTKSQQLENLLPASELSDLSNREFVGILSDDNKSDKPLEFRKFRDVPVIDLELRKNFHQHDLPDYIVGVSREELSAIIEQNYHAVFEDIKELIAQEHNRIMMGEKL